VITSDRSNLWHLDMHLRRKPSQRKLGQISEREAKEVWAKMCGLANQEGFVLEGMPRPISENCPNCGRLIRNPRARTCPFCTELL